MTVEFCRAMLILYVCCCRSATADDDFVFLLCRSAAAAADCYMFALMVLNEYDEMKRFSKNKV